MAFSKTMNFVIFDFFFINKFVEKKRINLLILERVIKELWGFEANLFLDISIMVPIKD